jgi:hypothetical protein
MSSAPTSAPKINTSTLPTTVPSSTSDPKPYKSLPPSTQAALTSALLSANSVPRIESALAQALSESGWTANLRAYITQLVRSGECVSYADVMKRVMQVVQQAEGEVGGVGSTKVLVNGGMAEREGPGMALPVAVLKEGVRAVRGEVEKVCDLRVDDVDD